MLHRVALPLVTAGYLALVAWLTLGSVSWHAIGYQADYGVLTPSIWFDSATWTTGSIFEFGANIALFVPVGLLFAMIAGPRRWLGALVAALALTIAIELAQIPMPDRISDPRDLLANSAGAAIGMVVAGVGWLVRAAWRAAVRHSTAVAAPDVRAVDRETELSRRAL
jgi:glycopeptide antibiotics resistance protein